MTKIIIIFFIFLLGLSVGSFINVLESRLYRGEDILKKPSHCDFCKKKLKWHDMIPVLSWVLYGGKSRCCRIRLSWQYPTVEFITGVTFVLIFLVTITNYKLLITNLTIQQFSNLVFYFFIFILAFSIFLQDLKYQAVHEKLLQIIVAITLIFNFIIGLNLIPAFLSALPFYIIYKLSKETWLGEGDVWIAFWMGLFLGFPRVLWAMYFGIIFGGVVSLIVLLLHLKKMRDTISLGPFLLIGVLISLLFK